MPHITPGNRLYLYQLFSREIGVGKQTMLARMEEVLAADDIMPCDLDCTDTRELLEALGDFVRLTVFKKGRVYATVMPQPAWDEILARAEAQAGTKDSSSSAKGGPKSWKRKRTKKDPRPTKPRPHGRPVKETPLDEAAAKVSVADVPATTTPAPSEEATIAEEPVSLAPAAETAEPQMNTPAVEVTTSVIDASASSDSSSMSAEETSAEPALAEEVSTKEARAARPEACAEHISAGAHDAPTEPSPTEEVPAATIETPSEEAPRKDAPPAQASPSEAPTLSGAPRTETPTAPVAIDLAELLATEQTATVQPIIIPTPEPAVAPTSAAESTSPEPVPTPKPLPAEHPNFPRHFATDVFCGDAQLSTLYQLLPFDADPMVILDEDWRMARSTKAFTQQGSAISFELRYLHKPEGKPIRVTIRRRGHGQEGKRWLLASVDANDLLEQGVSMDGLPTKPEGIWADLVESPRLPLDGMTPLRKLTNFAQLGPWNELLASLASLAAPEPWGDHYEVLKEYLTITFHRAQLDQLLAVSDDGVRAALDTGLLTSAGKPIYLHFLAQKDDIPWRLDRISTTEPDPVPQPISYVARLEDITLAHPFQAEPRTSLVEAYGPAMSSALQRSLYAARRNYRIATPAYDPIANELRLLLPLQLDGEPMRAVVLSSRPSGGYVATAVLPITRAHACARVITSELPRWLG